MELSYALVVTSYTEEFPSEVIRLIEVGRSVESYVTDSVEVNPRRWSVDVTVDGRGSLTGLFVELKVYADCELEKGLEQSGLRLLRVDVTTP